MLGLSIHGFLWSKQPRLWWCFLMIWWKYHCWQKMGSVKTKKGLHAFSIFCHKNQQNLSKTHVKLIPYDSIVSTTYQKSVYGNIYHSVFNLLILLLCIFVIFIDTFVTMIVWYYIWYNRTILNNSYTIIHRKMWHRSHQLLNLDLPQPWTCPSTSTSILLLPLLPLLLPPLIAATATTFFTTIIIAGIIACIFAGVLHQCWHL